MAYTVFLSSTRQDLIPYRDAVSRHLRQDRLPAERDGGLRRPRAGAARSLPAGGRGRRPLRRHLCLALRLRAPGLGGFDHGAGAPRSAEAATSRSSVSSSTRPSNGRPLPRGGRGGAQAGGAQATHPGAMRSSRPSRRRRVSRPACCRPHRWQERQARPTSRPSAASSSRSSTRSSASGSTASCARPCPRGGGCASAGRSGPTRWAGPPGREAGGAAGDVIEPIHDLFLRPGAEPAAPRTARERQDHRPPRARPRARPGGPPRSRGRRAGPLQPGLLEGAGPQPRRLDGPRAGAALPGRHQGGGGVDRARPDPAAPRRPGRGRAGLPAGLRRRDQCPPAGARPRRRHGGRLPHPGLRGAAGAPPARNRRGPAAPRRPRRSTSTSPRPALRSPGCARPWRAIAGLRELATSPLVLALLERTFQNAAPEDLPSGRRPGSSGSSRPT